MLKSTMKAMRTLLLACALLATSTVARDTPYTPQGKGQSVVAQVSSMIENSNIFPPDNKFLCRVAWVESKYGTAKGTFRYGYYGGIWQVDRIGYRDTVIRRSFAKYRVEISRVFKIDWSNTNWNDLTKPLYSGLAARLFLVKIPAPIPPASQIFSQAEYWKKYYNTVEGKGTIQKFVKDVHAAVGCAV